MGGEQKQQTPILICRTRVPMTLTSPLTDPKQSTPNMMLRKRLEKLERSSPPTIAGLVDRIERDAMSILSREQQKFVDGSAGAHDAAVDDPLLRASCIQRSVLPMTSLRRVQQLESLRALPTATLCAKYEMKLSTVWVILIFLVLNKS